MEHGLRVRGFKIFRSNYIRSLVEKLKLSEIDDSIFRMEVSRLNIVGTEVELNRHLSNEEIEKLIGYEGHIISIRHIRAIFEFYLAEAYASKVR